jgi:ATP-dependent Zn protease
LWLLVGAGLAVLAYALFVRPVRSGIREGPITQVIQDIRDGRVAEVHANTADDTVIARYKDGTQLASRAEDAESLPSLLTDARIDTPAVAGTTIVIYERSRWDSFVAALSFVVPTLLLLLVLSYLLVIGRRRGWR